MRALSVLREPVDSFFEHVLVNDEDVAVRANRLALLARIRAATGQVADFSKIAGTLLVELKQFCFCDGVAMDRRASAAPCGASGKSGRRRRRSPARNPSGRVNLIQIQRASDLAGLVHRANPRRRRRRPPARNPSGRVNLNQIHRASNWSCHQHDRAEALDLGSKFPPARHSNLTRKRSRPLSRDTTIPWRRRRC